MKILDVGGHYKTCKDATHVIDVLPPPSDMRDGIRYIQWDVCKTPWPFNNKEFSHIYCSNLLEDVKDPVTVCKEMMRVGQAGRIIVPSVIVECRPNIDGWPGKEKYAGFMHHRWLCFMDNAGIKFSLKTPLTHVYDWTAEISDEELKKKFYSVLDWEGDFNVWERVYSDWDAFYKELANHFNKDPERRLKEVL